MKTLFTTIAIATITFTSSVSATNAQLRPADNTFETKVCYTAATQGLKAAYELVRESSENFDRFTTILRCNGESLVRSARAFKQANQAQTTRKVRFVTDESIESKICLDAVILGADTAIEKHDVQHVNIICNNQDIKIFAKRFAGKTVSL
nr:ABC transporter ATP-binding protein [uncultured Glaciecola sp.]